MKLFSIIQNWIMGGTPLQRVPELQASVDKQCQQLRLYYLAGCPYCIKVRRYLWRLNLSMDLCNTQKFAFNQELNESGGLNQVPCLRIETDDKVQWLYESNDIIAYLQQRFS